MPLPFPSLFSTAAPPDRKTTTGVLICTLAVKVRVTTSPALAKLLPDSNVTVLIVGPEPVPVVKLRVVAFEIPA